MEQISQRTLDELARYLKLDDVTAEDVSDVKSLMMAAIVYAQNRTGKIFREDDELYLLSIKLLVTNWYENRNPVEIGKTATILPESVEMILDHISLCGDYP